jgi:hypothetical protein
MPPDAHSKIEEKVRDTFDSYMSISNSNPISFGIDSSRLYSKIKSIISDCPAEFSSMNGKVLNISFGEGKDKDDILISRTSPSCDFEFLVNRGYNDLGRVAALGLVSFSSGFSLYLTSSELCRGIDRCNGVGCGESVNDLQLSIINSKNEYCLSIKNHYGLENRMNNTLIMNSIMDDTRDYINTVESGFVNIRQLHDIVRKDEEDRRIIFKEGLNNLHNGELGFQVEDRGFKVWYPGPSGIDSPWCETYFHNDYEKATITDIKGFRNLFERTAYNVLKKEGDIKIKLEMISRIVDNKKKFDKAHPLHLYQ